MAGTEIVKDRTDLIQVLAESNEIGWIHVAPLRQQVPLPAQNSARIDVAQMNLQHDGTRSALPPPNWCEVEKYPPTLSAGHPRRRPRREQQTFQER
jgi:hypothetical protein